MAECIKYDMLSSVAINKILWLFSAFLIETEYVQNGFLKIKLQRIRALNTSFERIIANSSCPLNTSKQLSKFPLLLFRGEKIDKQGCLSIFSCMLNL